MNNQYRLETQAMTALRTAVGEAMKAGAGFPAMIMAYGEAGTGKTIAATELHVEYGGIMIRAFEGMTLAGFLQELCSESGYGRPHGTARCRTILLKALEKPTLPIFVDEADRLHISCLEALRDLHDVCGCPVVLIGELGLPTRVSARSRINDRIPGAFRVKFDSISKKDVALYAQGAAGLTLSMEATVETHAATKGNFRKVYNAVMLLERAARARGTADVDAAMARAALGTGKKAA